MGAYIKQEVEVIKAFLVAVRGIKCPSVIFRVSEA